MLNTRDIVDGVWQNGFDNCRVVRLYYPIDNDFENIYETLKIIQRGVLWLVYPCSFSSSSFSSIPDLRKFAKPMNNPLLELSMFHQKVKGRTDV